MVKGYVDGQYVLEKTPVDNQYVFYRRDRKTLRDGDAVIARRMLIIFGIGECIYGKRPGDSLDNIKSKISKDSRFLDLTTNETIIPIKHDYECKGKGLIKTIFSREP